MAYPYTIPEKIAFAKISQYLAFNARSKSSIFRSGSIDSDLFLKIKMTRESVEYGYAAYSDGATSFSTIEACADYMIGMCGVYYIKAQGIVSGGSGDVIYNPTTGQVLNGIIPQHFQYTVCATGSPLTDGITTYTITDTNIFAGTLSVHIDGSLIPQNVSTQLSYTVVYSPTSIAITFNQGLSCGMIVEFDYLKGGVASSGSPKASQPILYYTFTGDETEKAFTELVGIPLSDLRVVLRSGTGVQPVLGATTDSTQLQYVAGTGTFYPPTGDIFMEGSNLTIEYVS